MKRANRRFDPFICPINLLDRLKKFSQAYLSNWISDIRAQQRASRDAKIIRLSRLACPPSFWRGWTQEKISKVVGLDRSAVSRIVQNTKISEMHNLLSQAGTKYSSFRLHDLLKGAGWKITHYVELNIMGVM